jgi:hypothetical protein
MDETGPEGLRRIVWGSAEAATVDDLVDSCRHLGTTR